MLHRYLFPLVLLLLGCESYFGDTVPIADEEIPFTSEIVIRASILSSDSILYAWVSRGQNLLTERPPLRNANDDFFGDRDRGVKVSLFHDNELLGEFEYIPSNDRYGAEDPNSFTGLNDTAAFQTSVSNFRLERDWEWIAGSVYTLEVDHPELGLYILDQLMPNPAVIGEVTVGAPTRNFRGAPAFPVNLEITDPPASDDGYFIEATGRPIDVDENYELFTYLSDNDERTPDREFLIGNRILLDDLSFNGQSTGFTFLAAPTVNEPIENFTISKVTVANLSTDYRLFLQSLDRYQKLREDIETGFVEPFQLYSAVPGGFGFFGLGNVIEVEP